MNKERVYAMRFSQIYSLLVNKVERKGRSRQELDQIITCLTGYDAQAIEGLSHSDTDYLSFFQNAPAMNPQYVRVTGSICGVRVEKIEDEWMRKIRCLDKLVDELARGKSVEKILRILC